ncbi:MAG: hypothetical protein WBE72_04555 [Terracidiphilus sp.]
MAFTLDTPPGIIDIPDSLLSAGSLASGFAFSAIKENAAFGSVVPEVFFGTYANGQTVPLPISPVDGYQYEQSEILYCWEIYNTLPNGGATPSAPGALRACEWYVDQQTGTVHMMENYVIGNMKGGGTTTDGVLGVWSIGIRGRQLRSLAAQPVYTDLPNSTFAEDIAAQQTNLRELSHNAKRGSVQCEVFAVNPSNAPVWQANTAYTAGRLVQPTQESANGFWYIAANDGTSGALEPAWVSLFRNGSPIPDGGVIWNIAGCGFLHGQQVDYPTSEADGYQYTALDTIVPHLAFISTESAPVQFFSGVIDSSAPYPANYFAKVITNLQPALPTATSNRNFAPLVGRLNGDPTLYTALPPNLQMGTGTYVAPPAMALASPLLAPGTATTGVGIVNCGVQYSTGFFNDGTVMVTLFCFRAISAMAPNPDSSPAGQNFADFSTIAMTTGNPLTGPYMEDINENAKFSILRPEVFYCQYVPPPASTIQTGYFIISPDIIPGSQVPIPYSPTDGYRYSREELTYLWWFTASSGPQGVQEMDFSLYVDPQSGVINSTVQYIGLNSTAAGTNNANVGTVVYGAGGLLEANNINLAPAQVGQPYLRVIIFAQRQHETELQAQIVYSTTASAAQPSSTNLVPNGGFEIWSTPNPNYAEITGSADDWFVNWQQGSTTTTDMGITNALFQFPGQNVNPGAGPSAPYQALSGSFSQCVAVIPSAKNNNSASDPDSRKHVPLPNGSATLSIVSEIIPIWPGGEYALGFLAAAYHTTDFSPTGSTGSPEAGVYPDYIGAGFYARVHLLGQNPNGNGQPDMGTDTVFELLCDQANGGSLGLAAGLAAGTNNGYGIFGTPGNYISPPMCEQFNFTFTVPATAGVTGVPVVGTLAPGNSATPAGYVPSSAFNYGSTGSPNSGFFSTGLPATGPETIDFIPAFLYVEFLLWDIWGTGYDYLRVAVIDNVVLNDLTTGSSALLQIVNLGSATTATATNLASSIGSVPVQNALNVDAGGITGTTLPGMVVSSSLTKIGILSSGAVPISLVTGLGTGVEAAVSSAVNTSGGLVTYPISGISGLPVYANNAAAISGGLVAGDFYRLGGDPDQVCVVH